MRITLAPPYHPGPSCTDQIVTSRLAGIKLPPRIPLASSWGPLRLLRLIFAFSWESG